MKAVLLGRHEPNTPEWDGLRSHGIGGSEIAAIVGLSPWESRFSLWHRKRGTLGRKTVNSGMAWGTRLEPVIAQAFCEDHPELSARVGGTYCHGERRWQLGNPDLLLGPACGCAGICGCGDVADTGLLEVKTAHQYDAHEWGAGPEDIPPYYRCQVLWYLDVLELPTAHLAVLIGGSDYREYEIAYAASEAEWLREQGAEFWQSVLNGPTPDLDGSTATYEAVRALHPDIDGESIDIDPELHEWFQDSKRAAEQAATEHTAAKATVLDAMGTAQYADVDGERAYRRQKARGGAVALYPVPPFRADQTREKSA